MSRYPHLLAPPLSTHADPSAREQGYLRHTHEQTIVSSIEEGRRATTGAFYNSLETSMRKGWERQKEKLFEELGRHQAGGGVGGLGGEEGTPRRKTGAGGGYDRGVRFLASSSLFSPSSGRALTPLGGQSPITPAPSANSSLQMHSRMMRYDRVIRRLNEFRKEGYAFGLTAALGEASAAGGDAVRSALGSTDRRAHGRANAHS